MAIPKYYEIQFPILQLLSDRKEWKKKSLEIPLAKHFNLTSEELLITYASKNGLIFNDRINWALSYLNLAGTVSKPNKGVYQINAFGLELLKDENSFRKVFNRKIKERAKLYEKEDNNDELLDDNELISEENTTPEEKLYESFNAIKETVYREILDTILSKNPREFEKLVVELLQKMGYGGEIKDAGTVTQYSNDKGIDGVIKEDVLGFGKIYIQAKRYALENNISREDVQKFVGALAVAQSEKGVFITTSDYTKGAYEYVNSLNSSTKIVLLNGRKLAKYIYEYNLGMQIEKSFEIKKLDFDYWDLMENN